MAASDGTFAVVPDADPEDHDLTIHSQPLHFAFAVPFGLQTLGVSARLLVRNRQSVWRWYRIVTSLNNAEVWLRPRYLMSRNLLRYLRSRLDGGLNQLRYQVRRMR